MSRAGLERTLYLDVVGVCEEHGDAVDAHAPPGRGWQTVLQRRAERLVHHHGLVVTLRLGLGTSMHILIFTTKVYDSISKLWYALVITFVYLSCCPFHLDF